MATSASPTTSSSTLLQAVAGLPPPDHSLPALEPVKSRDQYRDRPEAEVEEATWYSADKQDTFAEPQQVRLRSIHSKQATVVTFTNKSSRHVRALWLDFKGNEVAYSILEPGNTKRYHTYVTHPWIVRELHSATRMMLSGRPAVVGLSVEQTVELQEPPVLNWSLSSHAAFPESYKSSVRGLLLAHKALEPYAAATQGPATSGALAARSVLQSPRKRTAFAPIRPASSPADQSCAAPCKRLCPVSPRASLLSHCTVPAQGPALPPLSPAGPKAYASLPAAFTAASHNQEPYHHNVEDAYTTTTTSISISSEASHFTATLTVSSPRRASVKSSVNIELAGAAGSNRATVNFDTFMTDVENDQAQQREASAPGSMDKLLLRPAAATAAHVDNSSSQAPEALKKPSRGLLSMLKLCTAPSTTSPRNMFKNLLSRPGMPHSSSKPVCTNNTISSPQMKQPAANSSLALDVRLRPVYTSLKVQVQHCDDMLLDDGSAAGACWPPTDTHLGNLPSHLLVYIAELAAPMTWQSLAAVPLGRPDIKPTLMACPPITAEEQQQLDEQEQQQAEQEQQQADNN